MVPEKPNEKPEATKSGFRFFLPNKDISLDLRVWIGHKTGNLFASLIKINRIPLTETLSGFVDRIDRRLFAYLALSFSFHAFVIVILGGAESTGKARGDVYAARTMRPLQLLLSAAEQKRDETPPEKLQEQLHSVESIPRNQSTKSKPADQSEASQGDQQLVVGPLSEMQYFKAKELDRRPIAQTFVDTGFPGVEEYPSGGWAILTLWVNEAGFVDSVRVEESSYPKSLLDPVVDRYRGVMFTPAEKDGRKVRAQMKILIEYPDIRSSLMGTARKK